MTTTFVDDWLAQEAARLEAMAQEAWEECWQGCWRSGNWRTDCTGPRYQYVAVPVPCDALGYQRAPTLTPEQLGFGPLWLPWNVGRDPYSRPYQTFIRHLAADGRLDFTRYPPIFSPLVWFALAQWRYQGPEPTTAW
jgi:hypothetical protein